MINLYNKTKIPQVSYQRVIQLIKDIHKKYQNVKENLNRENKSENEKNKITNFVSSLNGLFDICSCKCANFKDCNCEEKKVPENVRDFLFD